MLYPVLKRRLIFVPLPEPEPLQTKYRANLPSSGGPVAPLLHRRPLLQPGPLYYPEFCIHSVEIAVILL